MSVSNFFSHVGTGLLGLNQYLAEDLIKCLAQGHNTVPPVRHKPATSRSRVKHSTTEPLPSSSFIMWLLTS